MDRNCHPDEDPQPAMTMRRQDILDSLKCPVCFEIIFPPVMNCPSGHTICNFCLQKISQCPLCQISTQSFVKNKIAEDFLEKYIVRCGNYPLGCRRHEFKENSATIKLHEDSCKYRRIQCWVPNCTEKVVFGCLGNHWEQIHEVRSYGTDEESFEINFDSSSIPEYTTKAFHLTNSGYSFLAVFQALRDTREISVYMYGYCPKDLLPYFQSSITLEVNLNDHTGLKKNTHRWDGAVHYEQVHPSLIEADRRQFHSVLPTSPSPQQINCRLNVKIISNLSPANLPRRISIV